MTDNESLGVLKWMAGVILGVVVPDEEVGIKFGTELAVGRLRLGEAGVELTDNKEGVAVRV